MSPVALMIPAYNEAATIAGVIARAPRRCHGRPVVVVVVDDGSVDGTGDLAAAAGADVLRLATNQGLGAAVRAGIARALAHRPCAVAFCDADGEYAPEELANVVGPILDGSADYVVGSRFLGAPRTMRLHRSVGNRLLTAAVRRATRLPMTDAQSGYRAFSADCAADVRICHDYNYAQVLTIDAMQRGWRYHEVPIAYHRRLHGRSFVRLGPYLRAVLPVAFRMLRNPRSREADQSSTTCSAKRALAPTHARTSRVPDASASAAAKPSSIAW